VPEQNQIIVCSECGYEFNHESFGEVSTNPDCPSCGSTKYTIRVTIADPVSLFETIKLKVRIPGRKPHYESVKGDNLHRDSGIWMKLTRVIDRAKNWYEETVINPDTGEVMHQTSEPLSQHKGHGSDKKNKKA